VKFRRGTAARLVLVGTVVMAAAAATIFVLGAYVFGLL
jgi:hypothetical protein